MPTVLAISSFTAASCVGLSIITPALAFAGVESLAVPTVLYGRHPGWGAPGGRAISEKTFSSVLEGALAHPRGEALAGVMTGYFASPEQVLRAAAAIEELKSADQSLFYLCDPVMGDAPKGLYVRPETAEAIAERLAPLADVVTPNAWEAERLTGAEITDPRSALQAARRLRRPAVITSVPDGERIGAVAVDPTGAWWADAPKRPQPPNGVGDLFAALWLAFQIKRNETTRETLGDVVGVVDRVIVHCARWKRPEPPIAELARLIREAEPATVEAL